MKRYEEIDVVELYVIKRIEKLRDKVVVINYTKKEIAELKDVLAIISR